MKPRNIKYQEELKVLFERLYRNTGMTDGEWQEKYRLLSENADMRLLGDSIETFVKMGKTVEEAKDILETMFREKQTYKQDVP